jgi:hypothetical protein
LVEGNLDQRSVLDSFKSRAKIRVISLSRKKHCFGRRRANQHPSYAHLREEKMQIGDRKKAVEVELE